MKPEVIIFVGMQASGKTTFYNKFFKDTHVHISKDNMPKNCDKRKRQINLMIEALEQKKNIVIDNTHPTVESRAEIISVCKVYKVKLSCCSFIPNYEKSVERNEKRTDKAPIPIVGLRTFMKRYVKPTLEEGFEKIIEVDNE